MFGFLKQKSYLGIDVGSSGIKLVELRLEKKRPVLFSYGLTSAKQDIHKLQVREDKNLANLIGQDPKKSVSSVTDQFTDENIEKYSGIIKGLCKASKIISKTAVVSLPVSSVFHAVVTLPLVKKEELDHLIKAEVKKLLPVPLEEMALDFQVLTGLSSDQSQRVLVNAVPYKLIEFYSKVFSRSGLTLEALEPESTALTRCLMGRDQAVAMIIDIGSERTNFFIIDHGAPITHQTIESGGDKMDKILQNILGVESDLVEKIKYDLFDFLPSANNNNVSEQKWLDILMPVIDPMLKEIEISLEVYLRQTGNEGKRPEKIILTGGTALMPYLAKYIEGKFRIKCYVGDSWARVVYQDGLKPVLRQIGPRLSVAIGLALRSMV
ncbi:MAG: pilus assembly protein PilM [Candidatus Magasanikbacteria bacterium]|nr:pilus assembly protein PilM [Candidatus Magasanikbacteria bacterium]